MGTVTLQYEAPLGVRGGTIKVAGLKLSVLDVREKWNAMESRPVHCPACGARFVLRRGELTKEDACDRDVG